MHMANKTDCVLQYAARRVKIGGKARGNLSKSLKIRAIAKSNPITFKTNKITVKMDKIQQNRRFFQCFFILKVLYINVINKNNHELYTIVYGLVKITLYHSLSHCIAVNHTVSHPITLNHSLSQLISMCFIA
jgi:hypothetical protein